MIAQYSQTLRFDVLERKTAYDGFFRIESYKLSHQKFDGSWTPPIVREVFERGYAVAVLLYDPAADAVVLIEQFRAGALAAGLGPWGLEIVAGGMEMGESPEHVARRETFEETGCEILELERIGSFQPSPGGSSEVIHLYCGRVDSLTAGGIHGLAEENEDIKVHVLGREDAMEFLHLHHIDNMIAAFALTWLETAYPRLQYRWR